MTGILPSLPEQEDKARNALAGLFEDWWKKNLPQRDSLIITSMVFLVERSLDLQPRPLVRQKFFDMARFPYIHKLVCLIFISFKDKIKQYASVVEGGGGAPKICALMFHFFSDTRYQKVKMHCLLMIFCHFRLLM